MNCYNGLSLWVRIMRSLAVALICSIDGRLARWAMNKSHNESEYSLNKLLFNKMVQVQRLSIIKIRVLCVESLSPL